MPFNSRRSRRTAYQNSDADQSPVPRSIASKAAIQPGTVASRVQLLQAAGNPAPSPPLLRHPRSSVELRSRNLRSSFGRRVSGRFGLPALRNSNPSEELEAQRKHSYCGLNTARTNHVQDHAITECGGLVSQVQPQGGLKGAGCIDTPPVSSTLVTGSASLGNLPGSLIQVDGGNKTYCNNSIRSTHQRPINRAPEYGSIHRHGQTRLDRKSNSARSSRTTSSDRRQSVRDIFDDYGIEPPEGLVPDKDGHCGQATISKKVRNHSCCHMCSWMNLSNGNRCERCAHRLCEECCLEDLPQTVVVRRKRGRSHIPHVIDTKRQRRDRLERASTPYSMAMSPSNHLVEAHRDLRKVSSHASLKPTAVEQINPLLCGPNTTTCVQTSPFLALDRSPVKDQHRHYHHEHKVKHPHHNHGGSYVSATKDSYCPPAQEVFNPHCQAVTSTDKCHVPSESNESFATSVVEQESTQTHVVEEHSHLNQGPGPQSTIAVPQSVECHGYPRTGHDHTRRTSPIGTGIVGVCQHCLDDCQCAACQSTDHSVRCCVHESHKPMVHHHQTPLEIPRPPPRECTPQPQCEPNRPIINCMNPEIFSRNHAQAESATRFSVLKESRVTTKLTGKSCFTKEAPTGSSPSASKACEPRRRNLKGLFKLSRLKSPSFVLNAHRPQTPTTCLPADACSSSITGSKPACPPAAHQKELSHRLSIADLASKFDTPCAPSQGQAFFPGNSHTRTRSRYSARGVSRIPTRRRGILKNSSGASDPPCSNPPSRRCTPVAPIEHSLLEGQSGCPPIANDSCPKMDITLPRCADDANGEENDLCPADPVETWVHATSGNDYTEYNHQLAHTSREQLCVDAERPRTPGTCIPSRRYVSATAICDDGHHQNHIVPPYHSLPSRHAFPIRLNQHISPSIGIRSRRDYDSEAPQDFHQVGHHRQFNSLPSRRKYHTDFQTQSCVDSAPTREAFPVRFVPTGNSPDSYDSHTYPLLRRHYPDTPRYGSPLKRVEARSAYGEVDVEPSELHQLRMRKWQEPLGNQGLLDSVRCDAKGLQQESLSMHIASVGRTSNHPEEICCVPSVVQLSRSSSKKRLRLKQMETQPIYHDRWDRRQGGVEHDLCDDSLVTGPSPVRTHSMCDDEYVGIEHWPVTTCQMPPEFPTCTEGNLHEEMQNTPCGAGLEYECGDMRNAPAQCVEEQRSTSVHEHVQGVPGNVSATYIEERSETHSVHSHGHDHELGHDCVWKRRFLQRSEHDGHLKIGGVRRKGDLLGVSVVIHFEGRENVVINADLRDGCEVVKIGSRPRSLASG